MSISFLYVTTTNFENAQTLAKVLLESKLIACANILPKMQAMYWWEGKIEGNEETVLILKTTTEKIAEVSTKLKSIHPYQTPCIAEIKLDSLNDEYALWLKSSLQSKI
jgi:periplasmic divalent cation tolerance protein